MNTDEKPVTIPRQWAPPETPAAALKIASEIAEDERAWATGEWFSHDPAVDRLPVEVDEDRDREAGEDDPWLPRRYAFEAPDRNPNYLPRMCTDIRACSAAILLIAVRDGAMLRELWKGEIANYTDMLARHPVGGPAARFLAAGLKQAVTEADISVHVPEDADIRSGSLGGVINDITGMNDDECMHHAVIDKGFKAAYQLAVNAENEGVAA